MSRTAVCYLLHFDTPLDTGRHPQHYLGSAKDVAARLAAHTAGTGARLPAVMRERGIGFTLARTWTGGRQTERRLKQRRSGRQLCPICRNSVDSTSTEERS